MLLCSGVVSVLYNWGASNAWFQGLPKGFMGYALHTVSVDSIYERETDFVMAVTKGHRRVMYSAKRGAAHPQNAFDAPLVADIWGTPHRAQALADAWNIRTPMGAVGQMERVLGVPLRIPQKLEEIAAFVGAYSSLKVYRLPAAPQYPSTPG